jgi:hypothetical protein
MKLKEPSFIANFVTSPFAVWLLPSYHANIFMTTLFALIDPSLSAMDTTFSTFVYDAVRTLEEHWERMIDAIQVGALPDIHDLGEYRSHIEVWRLRFLNFFSVRRILTGRTLSGTFQTQS